MVSGATGGEFGCSRRPGIGVNMRHIINTLPHYDRDDSLLQSRTTCFVMSFYKYLNK